MEHQVLGAGGRSNHCLYFIEKSSNLQHSNCIRCPDRELCSKMEKKFKPRSMKPVQFKGWFHER